MRPALGVCALLLVCACGCGGGGEDEESRAGGSAAVAVTGFSSEPTAANGSFAAIHEHLRERPADLREAAVEHLAAEDEDVRYAALYALSLSAVEGETLDALRPSLESARVDDRLLAAGSLAVRGQKEALPVLIEALDSREPLAHRDPPQQAWQLARLVLLQFTDEDFGLIGERVDAEDAAAAKPAWEQWWQQHGSSLQWDEEAGYYR